MGRSGGAAKAKQPAEQLERLVDDSPGSLIEAPMRPHTPRRVAGAVALLVGVGAAVAVSLVLVWNFVLSHVMRAAMSHWAGY